MSDTINNSILILILSVITATIILFSLNQFTDCVNNNNNTEKFIDNYYRWNWNDPNMIALINNIDNSANCQNCSYSMSCDYTDDAQPFCFRSLNIPTRNINRNNSF
jgi:hypothetical protein